MSASITFGTCHNQCGSIPVCPAKWFDNFTFGLSFPGGNFLGNGMNQCTLATHASGEWENKEIWLMPGCDNLYDGYTYKISVENNLNVQSSGELKIRPDLISQYNNATGCTSSGQILIEPWNMPRSMAIAYKEMDLNGISVHLTEVAGPMETGPVKGWSCDTLITLYGFCDVEIDNGPIPVPIWKVVMPIQSAEVISNLAGLCYYTLLSKGNITGTPKVGTNINGKKIYLAVSVTTSKQAARISPITRHISVSVHGSTTNVQNMELS